jgi:hypothetical protein
LPATAPCASQSAKEEDWFGKKTVRLLDYVGDGVIQIEADGEKWYMDSMYLCGTRPVEHPVVIAHQPANPSPGPQNTPGPAVRWDHGQICKLDGSPTHLISVTGTEQLGSQYRHWLKLDAFSAGLLTYRVYNITCNGTMCSEVDPTNCHPDYIGYVWVIDNKSSGDWYFNFDEGHLN